MSGVLVGFSLSNNSSTFNDLSTTNGICSTLKAKRYRQIIYVSPFIVSFFDCNYGEKNSMTSVISIPYIDILNWVIGKSPEKI